MDNYRLFDYYRQSEDQNIVLSFEGIFSDKILVGLREAVIRELSGKTAQRIIKKICAVFIESAQNIYRHSAEKRRGIIFVEDRNDYYLIRSGNLIEILKFNSLIEKVNYINRLNKNDLKRFYLNRLRYPVKKGDIGGGLGLIVIARKSENPIGLTFHLAGSNVSFIEFSVKISKEEAC